MHVCPYSNVGHGVCKYIIAIIHEISRTWTAGSSTHIRAPDGCHYCHSKNTVKNGKRKCKRSRKKVKIPVPGLQTHVLRHAGLQGRIFEPDFITEALADVVK